MLVGCLAVVAVASLVAAIVCAWPILTTNQAAGAAVTAIATTLSALATASAAVAAWRAAVKTDQIANQSLRALGAASAPRVQADEAAVCTAVDGSAQYEIWNPTVWPAVGVEVVVTMADGGQVVRSIAYVEPNGNWGTGRNQTIEFPRRLVDPTGTERLEIYFWDERRILRWRSVLVNKLENFQGHVSISDHSQGGLTQIVET